ncbi:class I SAM-dependent methyltransferase [Streptomyces sp. ISL-22]|uniref:class I SAM-dependent methyltransferase n=1 Tax=unclassified Streptomyces TaxID=2593676 RepID=UPI001BEAD8DB|nr:MULTISPECIES: class I SAM-dependent methyltransferase [unclassified Streptomyces]MBT2421529.1 class I SAM-dependent methyltransferase [Streptomyces sp. ISL-24]MBT2435091.1 class I SAM-dependent methyltransferase [Streptomyces sp. ISL-22]
MERTSGTGVQAYYAESAERLGRVYESVSFEAVHGALLDLLPEAPARVLDVGAGTGRDAAALAGRGFTVDAVEPVAELRRVAERLHPGVGVTWRADALPELHGVQGPYDIVLLSAVWMHLGLEERPVAMRRLAELLAPGGTLLITLRRGEPPADRSMFDIPPEEVAGHGAEAGLTLLRIVDEGADRLGGEAVRWNSVALRKEQG